MLDPRLILGGQAADPIGQARGFADLLNTNQAMGLQQAQEQRTLADLAKKQQHEAGLLDLLLKAGPGSQQRLAALQSDPRYFGEATGYEEHLANVGAKTRVGDAAIAKQMAETKQQMVNLLSTTKDEADYQRRLGTLPEESRKMFPSTWAEAQPIIDALSISPEKRATLEAMAGRGPNVIGEDGTIYKTAGDTGKILKDESGNPIKARPLRGGGNGGGGAGGGTPKDWKDLTQAVSTGARGSLAKDLQKSLNSAQALTTLLKMPDGSLVNATPQQMREAYTALNGLIAKGGSQALGQIEHMSTDTLAGKFANLKQYITGNPHGQDTPGLVENILDTAKREATLAASQMRRQQVQSIPNYAHLRGADRKRFDAILKGAGIDPSSIDDSGLEIQGAGSGPAGGAPPQHSEAVAWARAALKKDPNNEKAKTILKMNGAK